LETLAHEHRERSPEAGRALDWLLREQERDGSWVGRWGANYVYGTGSVLPALAARGLPRDHAAVRSGGHWPPCPPNTRGGGGEGVGGGSAVLSRPHVEWPRRVDGLADGLGARRAPCRRRGRRRCSPARGGVAGRDAAGRRRLGRAVLHRHRLSGRLLSQLPP